MALNCYLSTEQSDSEESINYNADYILNRLKLSNGERSLFKNSTKDVRKEPSNCYVNQKSTDNNGRCDSNLINPLEGTQNNKILEGNDTPRKGHDNLKNTYIFYESYFSQFEKMPRYSLSESASDYSDPSSYDSTTSQETTSEQETRISRAEEVEDYEHPQDRQHFVIKSGNEANEVQYGAPLEMDSNENVRYSMYVHGDNVSINCDEDKRGKRKTNVDKFYMSIDNSLDNNNRSDISSFDARGDYEHQINELESSQEYTENLYEPEFETELLDNQSTISSKEDSFGDYKRENTNSLVPRGMTDCEINSISPDFEENIGYIASSNSESNKSNEINIDQGGSDAVRDATSLEVSRSPQDDSEKRRRMLLEERLVSLQEDLTRLRKELAEAKKKYQEESESIKVVSKELSGFRSNGIRSLQRDRNILNIGLKRLENEVREQLNAKRLKMVAQFGDKLSQVDELCSTELGNLEDAMEKLDRLNRMMCHWPSTSDRFGLNEAVFPRRNVHMDVTRKVDLHEIGEKSDKT